MKHNHSHALEEFLQGDPNLMQLHKLQKLKELKIYEILKYKLKRMKKGILTNLILELQD